MVHIKKKDKKEMRKNAEKEKENREA